MKFKADSTEMARLALWLHKAPRKFSKASAMWLNRAAYTVRERAADELRSNLTIRRDPFLRSRLRYQKVARGVSFAEQVAYAGSVSADEGKFSGWAEQEGLQPDRRTKTITMAARMGNSSRVVPQQHRLGATVSRITTRDYRGVPKSRRAIAMVADLEHKQERRPFLVKGHPALPAGLYRFQSGELLALQLTERRPKATAKRPWLSAVTNRYFQTISSRTVWTTIVRRIVLASK